MTYAIEFARYPDTWERVVTEQKIVDPVERRRAMQLFSLLMIENEHRYKQHKLGYLDAESWEDREEGIRLSVNLSIFEFWSQAPGYYARSPEFRQYMASLRD